MVMTKICLKFGPKGTEEPLSFFPSQVTIFVGPNNSGKSLLLREIDNFCMNGKNLNSQILEDISFDSLNDDEIRAAIEELKIEYVAGEKQEIGYVKYGKVNSAKGYLQYSLDPNTLIQWKNNKPNFQNFCNHFINMLSARFSGKERFKLIEDVPAGNLQSKPNSNLMALFQDDKKREKVRNLVYEAFGKYFVIDPTEIGKLKINLSNVKPNSSEEERGWHQEAVNFHKQANHILEFSDGVQAFTGITLSTIVGNEKYIFIDEPEAFLHPHLSNLLGKKLSELINGRDGNLMVSTHSSQFVMGCIQSGTKINIVRLTYDGEKNATARILPSEKLMPCSKTLF